MNYLILPFRTSKYKHRSITIGREGTLRERTQIQRIQRVFLSQFELTKKHNHPYWFSFPDQSYFSALHQPNAWCRLEFCVSFNKAWEQVWLLFIINSYRISETFGLPPEINVSLFHLVSWPYLAWGSLRWFQSFTIGIGFTQSLSNCTILPWNMFTWFDPASIFLKSV